MNIDTNFLIKICKLNSRTYKLIDYAHVDFIPDVHKSINIIQHINGLKDRSHMNILRDPEKSFGKIQHVKKHWGA